MVNRTSLLMVLPYHMAMLNPSTEWNNAQILILKDRFFLQLYLFRRQMLNMKFSLCQYIVWDPKCAFAHAREGANLGDSPPILLHPPVLLMDP